MAQAINPVDRMECAFLAGAAACSTAPAASVADTEPCATTALRFESKSRF